MTLININESADYVAAKAQQRQIGEMRITVALEQMRPASRNLKSWLLSRGSTEVRPRKWDWLDRATIIYGAMPTGQVANILHGIGIVPAEG